MFPALISEFITAEQEYRHSRSHRSFVERSHRRTARTLRADAADPREAARPARAATTWTARSA